MAPRQKSLPRTTPARQVPRRTAETEKAAITARGTGEGIRSQKIQVLLIDDEPSLLEVTRIYLEKDEGMQVTAVRTAHEGLVLLERESYDVVVTDHYLADMEGLELLRLVRELGNTIPFIIFTGRGREEVAVEALNSGADFYLQKGGDPKAQFAVLTSYIRQAVSRKRVENSLRESEERFKTLFERSAEAQLLMDGTAKVIDCNTAFLTLFSLKNKEEIRGHSPGDFAPEFQPDGVRSSERGDEIIAAVIREGMARYEWAHQKHDAARTPILTDVICTLIPIAGQPMIHVSIRDITESKKIEEALRDREQQLNNIMQNLPIGIFRTTPGPSGRRIMANPILARIHGFDSMEEFMQCPVADTYADPTVRKTISDRLIKEGVLSNVEIQLKKKNGELFWASLFVIAVRDPEGKVEYFDGVLDDITERKRSEDALHESERRYRNVVEDQTEFISRFLPDGTHVFVNEAYCRYFGKLREEILGSIFRPKILAEDREKVAQFFASLTPANPIGMIEHRIKMPDGSTRWQRWSDRAIFDDRGSLIEYQSVGRDITEVKAAEDALRESERRLQAIVMGSPIAMFVIDRAHKVISWNRALEEYSGIRRNEILGTSDHWRAFYDHERPCMADLIVDDAYNKIEEWYAGKCARSNLVEEAFEATDFFPKVGGGKWLFFTAAPIRDSDGRIIGAVETLEDITKRKRVEEALLASEELFRSLIDHLPEAALILDWEGTILFANPAAAKLVGLPSIDQGIGRNVMDFVSEESKAEVRQNLALVQKGTERFLRDYRIFTITGEPRWVQGVGLKISYQGREVDLVTLRDVTEQRLAAEQLRASETLYRTIVETTGTATAILDEKGTIILANAETERLFGYSVKEVVDTVPWTRFVPKHELPRLTEFWREIHEDPARSQQRYESELVDRGGNRKFGIVNATLIPDTHHVVVSIADITPLRQAELAIAASEEKFRNLFHSAQDAIYLASVAPDQMVGKFLEVNDAMCRMVGYSREHLLQMSPRDLDTPAVGQSRNAAIEELQARGHVTVETQLATSQGMMIPVEVSSHLFILRGEQVILFIARDITERKLNQEVERKAFEQIEKNINQLSILNDHLRNPLAVIVALADMEGGATMEKILEQAKAIDNIITELDMGWLESEKIREFMTKHYGVGKGIEQAYSPKK